MAHRLGRHSHTVALAALSASLIALALIAGCGDKKDKPATQSAVRVNKEEITVHQINAVLAQQRNLRQDQADVAARQVLEQLIDQELTVQKAVELKLDREAQVVQAIEAARRGIIARAYLDKIGEGVSKPTPAEIKDYYDKHPDLFKDRRVFQLLEIAVEATPDQVAALQMKFKSAKAPNEVTDYLKGENLKFSANQAVRAAEQIPLAALPKLAQMKDGQTLVDATPTGANVLILIASRAQPVGEEQAAKPIEAFLLNERKRKMAADDLKALRANAKIEYLGKYAASSPAAEPIKAANDGPGLGAGAATPTMAISVDAPAKAGSGVDAAPVRKGPGLN